MEFVDSAPLELEAAPDRFKRDIVWNLVPVALLGIVGLGLNFAIGGWWSPAALGVFNQVTIAFFAIAVLGAFGLQFAVLRTVAAERDARKIAQAVVGALIPNIVFSAIVTVGFVALAAPIGRMLDSEDVSRGVLWAAPGLFFFAINKVLFGVVNGLRRMRAFAVYTSLRYILIALGLALARIFEADASQLTVIWSFTEGTMFLVLAGELIATVKLSQGIRGWMPWARSHLDYGARGVVSTLAYEVGLKLDIWMIGVAFDDASVGIYGLAASIYEGLTQLAVVVQNNINPVIARELADGRFDRISKLIGTTQRLFVPFMIGIAAFGAAMYPAVIPWIVGNRAYLDGAVPFGIMMAGLAIASPRLPFAQVLLMGARPGWHTLYVLSIVVVNLVAALVLIPMLGIAGGAAAAATSLVVSTLVLRALVESQVGVRI